MEVSSGFHHLLMYGDGRYFGTISAVVLVIAVDMCWLMMLNSVVVVIIVGGAIEAIISVNFALYFVQSVWR